MVHDQEARIPELVPVDLGHVSVALQATDTRVIRVEDLHAKCSAGISVRIHGAQSTRGRQELPVG
jgi:hypothetical protein